MGKQEMKRSRSAEEREMMEVEKEKEGASLEDRLAIALTAEGSNKALSIRNKLMKDYVKEILSRESEDGSSLMGVITESWLRTMIRNGVTTKDMVQIQKMLGEDVQRSQSVSVKINAEAKAVKSTDEFLSGIVEGKKDGEA